MSIKCDCEILDLVHNLKDYERCPYKDEKVKEIFTSNFLRTAEDQRVAFITKLIFQHGIDKIYKDVIPKVQPWLFEYELAFNILRVSKGMNGVPCI
jgi:hypothetical protein